MTALLCYTKSIGRNYLMRRNLKMDTLEVIIRPALSEDVVKIADIEARCFPPAEAAPLKSFEERFAAFPECFFVAETKDGQVVGHINGCVTGEPNLPDELYHDAGLHKPDGAWQTVFGLAVLPEFQHKGIARALMEHLKVVSKDRGKEGIVLTCKEAKIGFYESFGYVNQGVSASSHGGAKWYDMVLRFS